MHQPWRTFVAIINRCISRKTTRLDRLRESRAQILWGIYKLNNADYVAVLWEDFMYQADNGEISSARKEHMPYPRFTNVIITHFISKDKSISMRNRINLHTVHDDPLLGTLKFVSKTKDYQKYGAVIPDGMINQDIKDSEAYKTYYDFATGKATPKKARKFKKVTSPSRILSPVLEAEPAKKAKRVKRPAKKSTPASTVGVIIKDTPGVSVSKKKAPAKADRGKGMELLSDAALLEAAQVPGAFEDKTTGIDEGTSTKPGVPDVPTYESESENESWDDDGNSDADDNETTNSDEDKNPDLNLKDDKEEETQDNEYVHTPDYYVPTDEETNDDNKEFDEEEHDDLYKVVDVKSLNVECAKEGKGNTEMTDTSREDVSQEKSYEQVVDDAHVTITQKIEIAYLMKIKGHNEEPSSQTSSHFTIPISSSTPITATPPSVTPLPQQSTTTPTPTMEPITSLIPALPGFSSLFGFDQRFSALEMELSQSYTAEFEKKAQAKKEKYIDIIEKSVKDIIKDEVKSQLPHILPKEISDFATPVIESTINESLENAVLAKSSSQPQSTYETATFLTESREDKDKDEDPPTGPYQGLKKRKISKDVEPLKGCKSKDSKLSSSKGTKSQTKSSRKFVQAEDPVSETVDTDMPQDQGDDMATKPPLTFDELMNTPIDFSAYVMNHLKIDNLTQQHLVGPTFNLLKGACKSRVELEYNFKECYKAVTYRLEWTSPEGHQYPFDLSKLLPVIEVQGRQVVPADYFINNDLEYLKGRSLSRKYTTYTTKSRAAKYVNIEGIEDTYDYGYLEEIEVQREDQTLHKFKEGDFPNLNLRDIEDMLLLLVQNKILNLERDVIFDLNVALRMTETYRSDISNKTPYTAYNNPQGIIYLDKLKRNRLIRSDELYKSCDGTLTSVKNVLHDIASNLRMEYLPKRRWNERDKTKSCIMIKAIDKQLYERRLMRILEKFMCNPCPFCVLNILILVL
ncbi:hypothetical protein Tco_1392475 [Tanacetum coccineum]